MCKSVVMAEIMKVCEEVENLLRNTSLSSVFDVKAAKNDECVMGIKICFRVQTTSTSSFEFFAHFIYFMHPFCYRVNEFVNIL